MVRIKWERGCGGVIGQNSMGSGWDWSEFNVVGGGGDWSEFHGEQVGLVRIQSLGGVLVRIPWGMDVIGQDSLGSGWDWSEFRGEWRFHSANIKFFIMPWTSVYSTTP